jgi:hypothetical protein
MMPKVGGKHFSYTPAGKAAAAKERKRVSGNKSAGPRQRVAKMRASGNKAGAYKGIRNMRSKR